MMPSTLSIKKIRDAGPSNTHVIQCQESSIQFGAVDQGTVAEAIFTIRNIMDFDISVRCRIAHVHLPGKPKINVFNIVTDELLLLQREAVSTLRLDIRQLLIFTQGHF